MAVSSFVTEICVGVCKSICTEVQTQAQMEVKTEWKKILSELKQLITSCPWYVYTPFAACTFAYILPKIMKFVADWIRSLRSERDNLKNAWHDESELNSSDTDSAEKIAQLEKRIEKLEATFERMEKLSEENQDYPVKRSIFPQEVSNVKFLVLN